MTATQSGVSQLIRVHTWSMVVASALGVAIADSFTSADSLVPASSGSDVDDSDCDDVATLAAGSTVVLMSEGAAGSVFCTWYGASATLVIQVRSVEPPVLVTSIRMEAAAAP